VFAGLEDLSGFELYSSLIGSKELYSKSKAKEGAKRSIAISRTTQTKACPLLHLKDWIVYHKYQTLLQRGSKCV
jgi:hypothetical protein